MKGAQGKREVETVRKISTGAADRMVSHMHGEQHLGTLLELCVCSLLSAAVESAWGSTATPVRPFVLD